MIHLRCPFCHDGVLESERAASCAACLARHHAECWKDHGGCGACGHRSRVGGARRLLLAAVALAGLVLGLAIAEARERTAPDAGAWFESAMTERAAGDLDAALADMDHAVAAAPRSEHAHRCRALVLAERGELEAAVAELTKTIEIAPRSPRGWALRGYFELERGDGASARRDLARAVALDPSFDWARAQLARARGLHDRC